MSAPTALLAEVPLFAGLRPEDQEVIAARLDEMKVPAKARIFSKGDPGGALYIVSDGEVEIIVEDTTGKRIVLETARRGNFFGELSLLDGQSRSADAVAVQDTHLLRVDREDLASLFQLNPTSALDMLTLMGSRLRETDRMLNTRREPNKEAERRGSAFERFADALAEFAGSIPFLLVHIAWFFIWVTINTGWYPFIPAFDPFPFGLLTMVVSLEAIFLSCVIMISQDRQAAKDRIRSEVEYEANIRAGLEVTQLHVKVDHLYEQAMARLEALERSAARKAS